MRPPLLHTIENIFGDGIGNIAMYDFSRANISEDTRRFHITTVASICYGSDKSIGKESLYSRLAAESAGLPSSSFEFVPVLLNAEKVKLVIWWAKFAGVVDTVHILKYGTLLESGDLITNYRALLYDYEHIKATQNTGAHDVMLSWYNTEAECKIINEHIFTFLTKMDMSTSKQYNRHSTSLQELSRRYVDNKKVKIELYHKQSMLAAIGPKLSAKVIAHGDQSIELYEELRAAGVKPQDARRVIPLSSYTNIWGSFSRFVINNFQELRLDGHSQWEIRMIAEAMQELLKRESIQGIYTKPTAS